MHEQPNECRDEMLELGLSFLDVGGRRAVYETRGGEHVVKFPLDSRMVTVNKKEANNWEAGQGDRVFAPIVDTDSEGRWLVMENYPERVKHPDPELYDRLDGAGWDCHDRRPENLGRKNGEVRMVDYESCSLNKNQPSYTPP